MDPGPELDAGRARIVDAGLTGVAVESLTPLVRSLPVDALTPVKQLLKRFFSDAAWTDADDDALAAAVGPPQGSGDTATARVELAPDLALAWRWTDGRFRLRVDRSGAAPDA
jgi:hypothetical protein